MAGTGLRKPANCRLTITSGFKNADYEGEIIMKYLRSLSIAIIILSIVACSGPGSDQTIAAHSADDRVFRWKITTTWPANFPVFQDAVERFADDVRTMSRGRLDIEVFAGGELVPPLQTFDAVSQGTIEMGHGASYYWAGRVPAAQFFSAVPFGMTAKGLEAWMYHGGGLELWRELYKPFNLYPIPMGNTGVQMGGWFNKRIDSVSDLKGLRMRIPGLGSNVLNKAGGNPVLTAGSEIYTSLERGVIDAAEWVGPFHDLRLGLNRAARYYYYPGWHEPGTEFELIINTNAWEQLPDDLKAIVDAAATATSLWLYSAMEYHNSKALQELRTRQNVQILEYPAEVLIALRELTRQTLEEEAAKDPNFRRVYESYQLFRDDHAKWNEVSEDSYHRSLLE